MTSVIGETEKIWLAYLQEQVNLFFLNISQYAVSVLTQPVIAQ